MRGTANINVTYALHNGEYQATVTVFLRSVGEYGLLYHLLVSDKEILDEPLHDQWGDLSSKKDCRMKRTIFRNTNYENLVLDMTTLVQEIETKLEEIYTFNASLAHVSKIINLIDL